MHFYCSKKETLKCKAKATVYATENPVEYSVVNFDKEHNHESLEGPVVADFIQAEMKQEYEKFPKKSILRVEVEGMLLDASQLSFLNIEPILIQRR